MLAAAAVPLALIARLVAVCVPVLGLAAAGPRFVRGTIPVLTWGGLRGGISVAFALSLPDVSGKTPILAATYTVVVFTIVAQGLGLRALVRRTVVELGSRRPPRGPERPGRRVVTLPSVAGNDAGLGVGRVPGLRERVRACCSGRRRPTSSRSRRG